MGQTDSDDTRRAQQHDYRVYGDLEHNATPVLIIRAGSAKMRAVKALQTLQQFFEYNPHSYGRSIVNTSKTSYLSIWNGDDARNAANDGIPPSILIGPLGYWETPFGFMGEIFGSWDASLVAGDAAGLTEYGGVR